MTGIEQFLFAAADLTAAGVRAYLEVMGLTLITGIGASAVRVAVLVPLAFAIRSTSRRSPLLALLLLCLELYLLNNRLASAGRPITLAELLGTVSFLGLGLLLLIPWRWWWRENWSWRWRKE